MKKTPPKDIFLQLFATAMFYLTIIGVFISSFALVDFYIPSAVDTYPTTIEQVGNMISFPLAMLVVAFPLFIWSTYKLQQRLDANATLQESKARSWLINLTLFLAAIIITITAITIVYSYFNGDLTSRTLLKSGIVVLLSILTIIWYKDREKSTIIDKKQKIVALTATVILITLVITAIATIGSPTERRKMKQDREVRYDLQSSYYNLQYYFSQNNTTTDAIFPENLETPETISYTRVNDSTAELCATFQTEYTEANDQINRRPTVPKNREGVTLSPEPNWNHSTGENCYTITIEE